MKKAVIVIAILALVCIGFVLDVSYMKAVLKTPQPEQWANGDLPAEFTKFFGTSNNARLNFVQSQAIAECSKRILALEALAVDPNDVGPK